MNYRTSVLLEATHLQLGDTLRVQCPRCGGGSSGEKSLSITRLGDDDVVWQCFRASCTERGGTDGSAISYVKTAEKVAKPRARFDGVTQALSEPTLERIRHLWGIVDPPYWYWTSDYGGRVAMSVRSPKYTHRGWVLRDISGRALSKTLTYMEEGQEALSWYRDHPDAPTIVVEDIPSAVRAAKYMNSVALLGTSIGAARAAEIASYSHRVILALDQDATAKSFRYAKKYGLMWDGPEILVLRKDLKNMEEDELCQILSVWVTPST